ncbi:MAG: hypothetical protein CSA76_03520 [Spirochaetales bacterium]|nr:MAG: hypothetical protein CSA76_03520 [Spirochaetales bacterium]
MIRTVQVEKVENQTLVMNNDIPPSENASSRRFWGVRERPYQVSNPGGLEIAPGDMVEIYLPPGRTILTSSLFFLLPLMLFPLGYYLTRSWLTLRGAAADAGDIEALAGLGGFALLAAGIPLGALLRGLAGRLAGRKGRTLSGVPRITRVLSPEEALAFRMKNKSCGSCTLCK